MAALDDNFNARIKRVRAKSGPDEAMPRRRPVGDDAFDAKVAWGAVLRPQLALILGMVALIVGRGICMNYLMIEPSTELLAPGEGVVVMVLLIGAGLMIGKSEFVSHGALVVGASLAFLGENFFIPVIPGLMSALYSPGYVSLVLVNAQ
jgi:hypothetical protein